MSTPSDPRIIQPYLFFNGRCEEALEFYSQTIGAKVEMKMRFSENPEPASPGMVPPGFEQKIMHASFRVGESVIMASDGCEEAKPDFKGFSLSLAVATEAESHRVFGALTEGGQVQMPLMKTFWSSCFGMLVDRFGVGWMITVRAD